MHHNVVVIFIITNYIFTAHIDFEPREMTVSLSDRNPFEELIIPIMDDNEYEGPNDELFFVQAHFDLNGQNSERVRIAPGLGEVMVNVMDNDVKPGIQLSITVV